MTTLHRTPGSSILRDDNDLTGVREIPLSKGMVAVVDEADYDLLSRYRWTAVRARCTTTLFYARGRPRGVGSSRVPEVYMHRLVLNATARQQVDHQNGNGLDNRRSNIRIATASQNSANRPVGVHSRSGLKGVWRITGKGYRREWRAVLTVNGRKHYLGHFATAEEAARAYDRKATEVFGVFARPNFPGGA